MAISYKFEVTKLSRDPSTNVVKSLDWKYTATDDTDGISVTEHGRGMQFEPLATDDAEFIPYDKLTKAKVKEWWEMHMNKNFRSKLLDPNAGNDRAEEEASIDKN